MRSIAMSTATVLLTGSLLGILTAPMGMADEPPQQSIPSVGTGVEFGTATGAQEAASPATKPTPQEEPSPPAGTADIQERGVLPGLVAPGAVLQFSAPTTSLSAIRNGIRVTAKSVSVNLRIPANLPVTVPVEVSVAYISPAQAQRQTKTYNPATGLVIPYHEAEGDGKPRSMRLDITVRELVPNGQSFSFSKQFTITPLYDVSITNLRFTMLSFCDRLGKADITLRWFLPDGRRNEAKFDIGNQEEKVISQFSWARKEITAQANLREPSVQFFERDFALGSRYHPPIGPSGTFLLPGPTKVVSFVLNEEKTGPPGQPILSSGCQAKIKYRITRELMTFDQF